MNKSIDFPKWPCCFDNWRNRDHLKLVINPIRDWRRLLVLWFISLLVLLLLATWIFWRWHSSQSDLASVPLPTAPTLSLERDLEHLVQYLEGRDERYQSLLDSVLTIVDPAL